VPSQNDIETQNYIFATGPGATWILGEDVITDGYTSSESSAKVKEGTSKSFDWNVASGTGYAVTDEVCVGPADLGMCTSTDFGFWDVLDLTYARSTLFSDQD